MTAEEYAERLERAKQEGSVKWQARANGEPYTSSKACPLCILADDLRDELDERGVLISLKEYCVLCPLYDGAETCCSPFMAWLAALRASWSSVLGPRATAASVLKAIQAIDVNAWTSHLLKQDYIQP